MTERDATFLARPHALPLPGTDPARELLDVVERVLADVRDADLPGPATFRAEPSGRAEPGAEDAASWAALLGRAEPRGEPAIWTLDCGTPNSVLVRLEAGLRAQPGPALILRASLLTPAARLRNRIVLAGAVTGLLAGGLGWVGETSAALALGSCGAVLVVYGLLHVGRPFAGGIWALEPAYAAAVAKILRAAGAR